MPVPVTLRAEEDEEDEAEAAPALLPATSSQTRARRQPRQRALTRRLNPLVRRVLLQHEIEGGGSLPLLLARA